jgi:hypothetical protein
MDKKYEGKVVIELEAYGSKKYVVSHKQAILIAEILGTATSISDTAYKKPDGDYEYVTYENKDQIAFTIKPVPLNVLTQEQYLEAVAANEEAIKQKAQQAEEPVTRDA